MMKEQWKIQTQLHETSLLFGIPFGNATHSPDYCPAFGFLGKAFSETFDL
jgi:hypothetical protein